MSDEMKAQARAMLESPDLRNFVLVGFFHGERDEPVALCGEASPQQMAYAAIMLMKKTQIGNL